MKVFLISVLALLCLASCSTMHKIKSSVVVHSDSTSVEHKDSVAVTRDTTKTDSLVIGNVDIDIYYDTTSQAPDTAIAKDTTAAIIKEVKQIIQAVPVRQKVNHISVHIGSITDLNKTIIKNDSVAYHNKDSTVLHKTITSKSKTVTRTGLSFGISLACGFGLLIILLFVAYKGYKKLSP